MSPPGAQSAPARPLAGVDAVVFDMDGVLVDSEPVNFRAMQEMLAARGVRYTEADDRRFRGRRNLDVYAWLRERGAVSATDEELERDLTARLTALIRAEVRPRPGVPEVPRTVRERGYRVALASSAVPAVIDANLAAVGLDSLFEVRVSGVEVERGKPEPDIFLETARRLGVAPARCLVVEDSRNGVLAARAAGMAVVAIPCEATRDEDLSAATLHLPTLLELPPLLPARAGA